LESSNLYSKHEFDQDQLHTPVVNALLTVFPARMLNY